MEMDGVLMENSREPNSEEIASGDEEDEGIVVPSSFGATGFSMAGQVTAEKLEALMKLEHLERIPLDMIRRI
ncbi:hypothetical protein V2J09_020600 [Rumex salicifolius]